MESEHIYIIYGSRPKDMVKELLAHIRIENEIPGNARIGIKPNLVVAKPHSSGATTSPELTAGLIEYLQAAGFKRISILESSWVGESTAAAFRVCGYEELSRRYNVPLIDLQRDGSKEYDAGGMKINVCNKVMEVDYLINLPVLKGHCQTNITCALKNMKGCIPNSEKRKFHTMGLHKPIAHLNRVIKQNLVIVDGIAGDLDFEEGGNPVQMNRLIAGRDPVLIDAYAAQLLGYALEEIPYIGMAERLGIGKADLSKAVLHELNKDNGLEHIASSRKIQRLAGHIAERDACSACYGSLIHALGRLDEQGKLGRLTEKLHIGQGYKGLQCKGIGVGSCTRGFEKYIEGCPAKAKDIVDFFRV